MDDSEEVEAQKSNAEMDRLLEILTTNEFNCLVDALETVINNQNGYGTIEIDVRQKRIYILGIKSTIKPSSE